MDSIYDIRGNVTDAAASQVHEVMPERSPEEIQYYLGVAVRLANKPISYALIALLQEYGAKDPSRAGELKAEVKKRISDKELGFFKIEVDEHKYVINICLDLVNRNYKVFARVPHEKYSAGIHEFYGILRKTAQDYWCHYRMEHADLVRQIDEFFPEIDFSELHVDPDNNLTLYFCPNSIKRVGINITYMDNEGHLLRPIER